MRVTRPRHHLLALLAALVCAAPACKPSAPEPGSGGVTPDTAATQESPTTGDASSPPREPPPADATAPGPVPEGDHPFSEDVRGLIRGHEAIAALEGPAQERVEILDDAAFDARRDDWYARHFDATRTAAEGRALKALGLFPDARNYGKALRSLHRDVDIFYDELERTILIRKRLTSDPQAGVLLAQHLALALQDQHFGLDRLLGLDGEARPDDDLLLARTSLVQGVALAIGLDAGRGRETFLFDPEAGAVLDTIEARTLEARPEDDPLAFLIRLNLFSLQGTRYALHQLEAGAPLHALYERLPDTSRALLYPEEQPPAPPVTVSTDLAMKTLGAYGGDGPSYENVLGAFGLKAWLELVGERDDADAIVAGWRGDRLYTLPVDPEGDAVYVVHLSVWRDEAAAQAFEEAAAELFERRYGPRAWRESALERRGTRVVWLEGTYPSKERAASFLEHAHEHFQERTP